MNIFLFIYIYIFWYPPKKVYLFHGQRRYHIYIYIIFDVLEVLDFVLEGEELV